MERFVCDIEELSEQRAVVFDAFVRGELRPCFVVLSETGPAAYLNVCAHRNQPVVVDEHPFEDGLVECRAHGAFYRPDTGECVDGPCVGAVLVSVPLRVEGSRVSAIDDDAIDDSMYASYEEEGV